MMKKTLAIFLIIFSMIACSSENVEQEYEYDYSSDESFCEDIY